MTPNDINEPGGHQAQDVATPDAADLDPAAERGENQTVDDSRNAIFFESLPPFSRYTVSVL